MEEESKMSLWQKIKASIVKLEEYQKLATQKIGKTIGYLAVLVAIFTFFVTLCVTYKFHQTVNSAAQYIDQNIEVLNFKQGVLTITAKDKPEQGVMIDEEQGFNGKIIIDTSDLSQEQIDTYTKEIGNYTNGILILKNKIILRPNQINMTGTISLEEIANQLNLVNVEKQDITNFIFGNKMYELDVAFFIVMFIAIFINFIATTLLDVILYSIIAYAVGVCTRLRLRYKAAYNIAAYSLTLPIILNMLYAIINILTGYTISYFSIMYMAITCIYIITAILMIKSDVIKKQMELSKIIAEQEKVKQELARRELEKQEEEERERVRKEDEKKRQEEKKKKEEGEKKLPKGEGSPQPEANINPSN